MKKNFLSLLLVVVITTIFSACSDKNDPPGSSDSLVGTWVEEAVADDESPYILTFNSDQTGSLKFEINNDTRATLSVEQRFKWSTGVTSDGLSYVNILTVSGDEILEDGRYIYTLIGNSLSFGSIRFTRRR